MKSKKIQKLNGVYADLEKLKFEKQEEIAAAKVHFQREFNEKLFEKENQLRAAAEEKYLFKNRELQKKLDDQIKLNAIQQQKLEQGSMQIQGEVQEQEIEKWLKTNFPSDEIVEIKVGQKGADIIQNINEFGFKNCGSIYYESKRTKNFNNKWIKKLKSDMQEKNANIGVLITKTLPSDMSRMGVKDDILICNFEEFKGLCYILRDQLLIRSRMNIIHENKSEKKLQLYNYLTSQEFRSNMEAIVDSYLSMKFELEKEIMQSNSNFEKRKAQLNTIITTNAKIYGRFNGIAGGTLPKVDLLEFDEITPNKSGVDLLNNIAAITSSKITD